VDRRLLGSGSKMLSSIQNAVLQMEIARRSFQEGVKASKRAIFVSDDIQPLNRIVSLDADSAN
jgi:hypothetical protein